MPQLAWGLSLSHSQITQTKDLKKTLAFTNGREEKEWNKSELGPTLSKSIMFILYIQLLLL